MRLERRYEAEAAHRLTAGLPEDHQCRRLHGHRYVIIVTLIGDLNPETGMVMEYADIDKRVQEVLRWVDHRFINELYIAGTPTQDLITSEMCREPALASKVREHSTVENLAAWFIAELKHRFPRENLHVGPTAFLSPQVYSVRIEEDSRSAVEV
jgi:6-pyruvoyltetrahydropterin/6-carboxytetrahydropterin synthase